MEAFHSHKLLTLLCHKLRSQEKKQDNPPKFGEATWLPTLLVYKFALWVSKIDELCPWAVCVPALETALGPALQTWDLIYKNPQIHRRNNPMMLQQCWVTPGCRWRSSHQQGSVILYDQRTIVAPLWASVRHENIWRMCNWDSLPCNKHCKEH